MAMEFTGGFLLFSIFVVFLLVNLSSVEGRYHFHKKKQGSNSNSDHSDPHSPVYPPSDPPISCDPRYSSSDPCIFDVMSYGAVGDGSTDDTAAFRLAWQEACSVEFGVLFVPSDYIFTITSTIFSGPCKQGFVFQIDGILMPPNGPDCWPESDSHHQWLVFYRVDRMTFQGSGTVEGNGEKWWNIPCKPHRGPNGSTLPGPCDSPAAIRFFDSSNLTDRDLKIQNSPQFHVKFDACSDILIENLAISSPALSPNTDGIHIENTRSVGIYNSVIGTGDDCISIGPGRSEVDIENVTCGPSHGIRGLCFKNAVMRNSDNGVGIKTWQGGMGSVSGITFDNVLMDNVRNCIIIDQYYCYTKGCHNQTSAVFVSNVQYTNIKGTYDVRSPPIHFACSDTVPCANITLSEVELLPSLGELVLDPFCWNAYGALQTLTIPPVTCLQDGSPQSLAEGSRYGC